MDLQNLKQKIEAANKKIEEKRAELSAEEEQLKDLMEMQQIQAQLISANESLLTRLSILAHKNNYDLSEYFSSLLVYTEALLGEKNVEEASVEMDDEKKDEDIKLEQTENPAKEDIEKNIKVPVHKVNRHEGKDIRFIASKVAELKKEEKAENKDEVNETKPLKIEETFVFENPFTMDVSSASETSKGDSKEDEEVMDVEKSNSAPSTIELFAPIDNDEKKQEKDSVIEPPRVPIPTPISIEEDFNDTFTVAAVDPQKQDEEAMKHIQNPDTGEKYSINDPVPFEKKPEIAPKQLPPVPKNPEEIAALFGLKELPIYPEGLNNSKDDSNKSDDVFKAQPNNAAQEPVKEPIKTENGEKKAKKGFVKRVTGRSLKTWKNRTEKLWHGIKSICTLENMTGRSEQYCEINLMISDFRQNYKERSKEENEAFLNNLHSMILSASLKGDEKSILSKKGDKIERLNDKWNKKRRKSR